MPTALISDIQRFSRHDGPGIRTTVFFKGCPLRCQWCHNPETLSFEAQTLWYPEKCIQCGQCDQGCYSGARVLCGKEMSVDQVLGEVLADKPYYACQGGVTLSGGEPLSRPEFCRELLQKCKEEGIGTAIETSLFYFDAQVLSLCDVIMADVKIWDSHAHKRFVGAGNERILENIRRADELGIPMILRTPIVPGVNDTAENVGSTAAFIKTLKNAQSYQLLPYHPLGHSKARALGMEPLEFEVPTKEKMEELKQYAQL